MTPAGEIQSISGRLIERRLQEIDLGRYRIELVWNDVEQGLHVIQIPRFYHGVDLTSWFWDRRHNAWFEDDFTTASKQCTAAAILDGDKFSDRSVVFGCEDGFVRKGDRRRDDDDGDAIFSRVLIGPLTDESSSSNFRFSQVQVELASEQAGADYAVFTSRVADKQGAPVFTGSLQAGPNGIIQHTLRGGSAWVRLRNGVNDERWALESVSMAMYPAGRKRMR